MKIAGVVNNYDEALEIEDIVKNFIIKERILNLSSLNKMENSKIVTNPEIKIFQRNDIRYPEAYNKKNLHYKNNGGFKRVFNVRGLG